MFRALTAAAAALFMLTLAAPARAAEPAPLSIYGALPKVELIELSPSAKRVAFVTVTGDARKLVVSEIEGGKPLLITPVGETKVRELIWAGEDHLLVINSQAVPIGRGHKAEVSSIFDVDLKTRNGFFLLGGKTSAAVVGFYGAREVKGRWYAWVAGFDDEFNRNLYRVDLQTQAFEEVSTHNRGDNSWTVDADGVVIAHSVYDQSNGDWRLRAGATVGRLIAERSSPTHAVGVLGLGRTPGTLVIRDETDDGYTYAELPVDGSAAPTPLLPGKGLKQAFHDRNGRLIGFALWKTPGAAFFDPALDARYRAMRKAFAGLSVSVISHTDDLGKMIVFTDGKGDSGSYWMVDMTTGDAAELGHAYPALPAEAIAPTQVIHYKAADGLAMEGLLTLPPGREVSGLPLVVLPHGGPIADGDHPGFDWWAQAFASRGYAVFQPNYRGTLGYGDDFRNAANGEWGRKMQTDISDGVAALAASGFIDPKRACIVGASYGGYAALAGVTLQHGLYRCAVSVAGVSDLKTMLDWEQGGSDAAANEDTRYWREVMGVTSNSDARLKAVSPAQLADQADAPILLIHGKDDSVVPMVQSEMMRRALDKAEKPVKFIQLSGEDHWLSRQETRTAMLEAAVAFVLQHNPPN